MEKKRAETHKERTKLNLWKKAVLKKYNYKCFVTETIKVPLQKLGVKIRGKEPLVIHHLDSWDNNATRRYDVTNGVVLLKSIHYAFHNEYGFGNNTVLQFEKFIREHYDIQTFPWKYGNHEPNFIYNELKQDVVTKNAKNGYQEPC